MSGGAPATITGEPAHSWALPKAGQASVTLGTPSWPQALSPQHHAAPPGSSAQVWSAPAEIWLNDRPPATLTGTMPPGAPGLPRTPYSLLPQQLAAPPASSAQVCVLPALT